MNLIRMGDWIDAFRPTKDAPPQKLGQFFKWSLAGSWGQLALASLLSALAGVTEVVSAIVLGWVIDAAIGGNPARVRTRSCFIAKT